MSDKDRIKELELKISKLEEDIKNLERKLIDAKRQSLRQRNNAWI